MSVLVGLVGVAAVSVIVFFVSRWLLVEIYAAWNRWQFSMRPEVENWALPYVGTQTPATVWAILLAAIFMLIGGLIASRALRRHGSGALVS